MIGKRLVAVAVIGIFAVQAVAGPAENVSVDNCKRIKPVVLPKGTKVKFPSAAIPKRTKCDLICVGRFDVEKCYVAKKLVEKQKQLLVDCERRKDCSDFSGSFWTPFLAGFAAASIITSLLWVLVVRR